MNQLQLTDERIRQLPVETLTRRTLSILVTNDLEGYLKMVRYFSTNNSPRFEELLKVRDRLPDLELKLGLADLGKIVMAELMKYVSCYTVIRPMNADQIAQCSIAIISSSVEDKLSLQDLVLFFEGAKQGKYGRVYDHIDQHLIFEMLEQYRQERYKALKNIRYEQEVNFKANGNSSRTSEEKEETEVSVRKVMVDFYKTEVLNKSDLPDNGVQESKLNRSSEQINTH